MQRHRGLSSITNYGFAFEQACLLFEYSNCIRYVVPLRTVFCGTTKPLLLNGPSRKAHSSPISSDSNGLGLNQPLPGTASVIASNTSCDMTLNVLSGCKPFGVGAVGFAAKLSTPQNLGSIYGIIVKMVLPISLKATALWNAQNAGLGLVVDALQSPTGIPIVPVLQ